MSSPHRGGASTTFSLGRRVAAEAIGTFALVFAGTGAIVVDGLTGGEITHLGVALAFGLVVMTMIHAIGDVSGGHLNPAVTVGFWVSRRFPLRDVPGYVAGQCVGAAAGSLTVAGLFTRAAGVGVTAPAGGPWPSFALEVVLTALLMFVILGVSTGAREKGITAGIAVGAAVTLGALVGGPVSGASMNPARSLGPALVAADLHHLWIYVTAPVLGAVVAAGAAKWLRGGPPHWTHLRRPGIMAGSRPARTPACRNHTS